MITHNPPHSGEFIQQAYLDGLQVNARTIAKKLGWKDEYGLNEMCEDSWRWQSKKPDGYKSYN